MSTPATGPRTGGVDAMLAHSRAALRRLSPQQAQVAVARGALLVDTRTPWQREAQGELPGAIVIDRTVLEWRLDPSCDSRIPEAVGPSTIASPRLQMKTNRDHFVQPHNVSWFYRFQL